MGPVKHDSILVTVSCFLKSIALGFLDLDVPPTSLTTSNGRLLIKLPNPIILFVLNWVYSSGLFNILCSCIAQFHYMLCEEVLPLGFVLLNSLLEPFLGTFSVSHLFLSRLSEGSMGPTKHSYSSWGEQTSCLPEHKLQSCYCEGVTLTTQHRYCHTCQLPQLWYNPDLWKLPSHVWTQDPCRRKRDNSTDLPQP